MENTFELTPQIGQTSQQIGPLGWIVRLILIIRNILIRSDDPAALRYLSNKYPGELD
jgi:hypothetical protein